MRRILLILLFLPMTFFAQVIDDFSDGNFSNNPTWTGNATDYIVNSNFQLQLNAEAAGSSYLSLPIAESQETEWHFWIREAFSPSGNNYTDVYLCADQADLTQASQGYFLRFGESGSNDAIELFRKDNESTRSICRGTTGAIASSFSVAVKMICDREGNWTLQTSYDQSGNYSIEAVGVDDSYNRTGYFGFLSTYTSSNAKKIYFDDVYIGPKIIDHEPPALISVEVADSQTLRLSFSESLSEETAINANNYLVDNGIGHPETVSFGENPSIVNLSFATSFLNAVNYLLTVDHISDLSGNTMATTTQSFSIFQASANDVVINEIMADPSPMVGLPEWEYVELYNTTDLNIDLNGWTLTIGSTQKTFGPCHLNAHGYLIVCHADAVQDLASYGPSYGLLTSSTAITNGGTVIRLCNSDEEIITEVSFNIGWYHDTNKNGGGWSLEQIDPMNPCAGSSNWTASVDTSGGTPGHLNSVDAPNESKPMVERIGMFSNTIVQLWFDQQMQAASLEDLDHYIVEETDNRPIEANANPNDPSFVELIFSEPFEEGRIYTLIVNGVENCIGNTIESDTKVRFGIPNELTENDIVINEILFDPIAPGVDYVELYNPTEKTFDLSTMMLGLIRESFPNPADTTLKEIGSSSRLFLPGTYLLLSTNKDIVGQQYNCPTDNFVDMESFPNYVNSGGTAFLMSKSGTVVDQMDFSAKMHYPLLKETKGVSLERVSFAIPSSDPDNWHSAAESVGFGTPGYANSMMQNPAETTDAISIDPELFSPDGDGFDDVCFVNYNFDQPGYTMKCFIFSTGGHIVRHLNRGELVAQEGSLAWNGLDDNGNRVPVGIYVVVTEVFNFDGVVKRYKKAVVVTTK